MKKLFVDTNVLVYAKDTTAPTKMRQAQTWVQAVIEADALVLSAQSLREFYWNVLKMDRSAAAVTALRNETAELEPYVPELLRVDRMGEAWAIQDRHKISFWDSLLVASALAAGCTIFLSEDLNGGQKIDALTIVNPFTAAPEAVLGA